MDIRFTNKRLEKISKNEKLLLEHARESGVDKPLQAVSGIQLALSHIDAAPSMYDIPEYFRPHPLTTDRKGQYGIDVTKSHRLVMRPDHEDTTDFNWENMKNITRVVILHLSKDYHKKKETL